MSKRLYKSSNDRMISGVCGGVAEFFGIDSTMIRLGWVLFAFFGGSGILAYIIAAIIIPTDPNPNHYGNNENDIKEDGGWR